MTSWLRVLIGVTMVLSTWLLPHRGSEVPRVVLSDTGVGFGGEYETCIGCNPLIFGQPLNINKAPIDHLELLPNIGTTRAKAIVDAREIERFQIREDLDDVRGIGPKTLIQLVPLIVFD